MENKNEVTDVSSSPANGYADRKNSGKFVEGIRKIKYTNSKTGKEQTQSYYVMDDVVIPVILRRNEENGKIEFAIQYEYIPAIHKVNIELPDYSLERDKDGNKKGSYSKEECEEILRRQLEELGIEVGRYLPIENTNTAVSQSFTDQMATFGEIYVRENYASDFFEWLPITSLNSLLENKEIGMSLQTRYVLQCFASEHKKELDSKDSTEFIPDKDTLNRETNVVRNFETMQHKYRFGGEVEEIKGFESTKIRDFGNIAEFGKSKNSSQCLLVRKNENKIQVGLAKQQRSPFIDRNNVEEHFYEAAAGMLENGENYEIAATRELKEETGYDIKESDLICLSDETLLSKGTQEFSKFFMCRVDEVQKGETNFDEQEDIGDIEWFDMDSINLNELHAPLPTKFLIQKAKIYFERLKDKEKSFEDIR